MGPFNYVEVMRELRESITLLPIGSTGCEEIWLACFVADVAEHNFHPITETKDVLPDGHKDTKIYPIGL